MLKFTLLVLFQVILILIRNCDSVPLPQWVWRVKSCPDPNNITQWKKASERLNCFNDLTSKDPTEQGVVYHCLPSTYMNESVEFCGRSVPIAPGNCPVYNYKYAQNKAPSYYNCSNFTTGCPERMFHSKEVYKYPTCLRLKLGCYEADLKCMNKKLTSIPVTTVPLTETTRLESSFKPNSSNNDQGSENGRPPDVGMNPITEYENGSQYLPILIVLVVIAIVPISVIALWKRRHLPCLQEKTVKARNISEEKFEEYKALMKNIVSSKEPSETVEMENISQKNEVSANLEGRQNIPKLEECSKGATNFEYNNLLVSLGKEMSPELMNRIKSRLRERDENTSDDIESNQKSASDDLTNITEPSALFDYLSKKYLAFNNIAFLQGIFLATKAPKLYDRCLRYAEERSDEIIYFEKRVLENSHKKVVYIINCPNVNCYNRSEVEKLRRLVATLIHANFDDVIVSGVRNGCVIVTFMIRNCLIPTLRAKYAPSKRNLTYQWMMSLPLQYKIVKVTIEDDVVYMPDQLMSVEGLTKEAKLADSAVKLCYPSCYEDKDQIRIPSDGSIKILPEYDTSDESVDIMPEKYKENCIRDDEKILSLEKNTKQTIVLNKFLEELSADISDDILKSMKFLLHDFIGKDEITKMNTSMIFDHLSTKFHLAYNMCLLRWMFVKCGENRLSEKCSQFESENRFELLCFHSEATPCKERQHLEFHIMVLELEAYQAEVYDLRNWLAKTIDVHPGEILMTALENGPIVVTFMMREKHAKAFSEFIQTDDGQIAVSRQRVGKIFHDGKLIKIGRALNGSNFIHVRLRFQESVPRQILNRGKEMVTSAISHILRDTNVQMQGNEVYVRATPNDRSANDDKEEESFARKDILNNWDSLVAELEPLTALNELKSCFDESFVEKINEMNCRKERAILFLNKCCELPRDEVEKVWNYLKELCSTVEEDNDELESTRQWIKTNWDEVIDEIDNDFIDTTIQNIQDVPRKVYDAWNDGHKKRKEKAKMFLDFVLTRHDCLKALQETLHECGMDCPQTSNKEV